MKKFVLTSAIVLFIGFTVFAQDTNDNKKWYVNELTADAASSSPELYFDVHGKYSLPVKKEKLNNAKFIGDFISDYPVNWIINYVSVEVSATFNGKTMKAMSPNQALSAEQKNILASADLGTGIEVNVNYKYKNTVTDDINNHVMHVSMMIIPEVEAEYIGGKQQLKKFIKENVINKISDANTRQLMDATATVIFTVNEKGEIIHAKISNGSGNSKTDKLLLDGINKMPERGVVRTASNANAL